MSTPGVCRERTVAAGFIKLRQDDVRSAVEHFAPHSKRPRATQALFGARRRAGRRTIGWSDTTRVTTEQAIAELMRGERTEEAALVVAGRHSSVEIPEAVEMLSRLLSDAPPGRPAGSSRRSDADRFRLAPGHPDLLARLAARAA